MTPGLYFPPTLTSDGLRKESCNPPTSRDLCQVPAGPSKVEDRLPAERLRGAELTASIITWLYESADEILVDDDGEEPVRLDVLLEAIYELHGDAALVRRWSKFLALVLVSHRWPMTIHGTAAVPTQRVLNLLGVSR